MLSNWVYADNLRPFLLTLGWFVGYAFDDDGWSAIRFGVEGTDEEADRWFDYKFEGKSSARFRLAVDPGTSVVHARVEVPAVAEPKVEAALSIFQHFRVQPDT